MVQNGANVNFQIKDQDAHHNGWTALLEVLHTAFVYSKEGIQPSDVLNYFKLIDFLLENGADITKKLRSDCKSQSGCDPEIFPRNCYTCSGTDACSYNKFYSIPGCEGKSDSPEPTLEQVCNVTGSLKNDGSACTIGKACPYDYDEICTCAKGYTGEKCDSESGMYNSLEL